MRKVVRARSDRAPKLGFTPRTVACLLAVAMAQASFLVRAQSTPQAKPTPDSQAATEGPSWKDLTRAQQTALKPLERDWWRIDGPRKRKWLEIAARYPAMSIDERERVQDRMSEWVRLSPQERNAARLNYRLAKELP